jgi:hypothetical protein
MELFYNKRACHGIGSVEKQACIDGDGLASYEVRFLASDVGYESCNVVGYSVVSQNRLFCALFPRQCGSSSPRAKQEGMTHYFEIFSFLQEWHT